LTQLTCPICKTPIQTTSTTCRTCGAIISIPQKENKQAIRDHTYIHTDTDLLETQTKSHNKQTNTTTRTALVILTTVIITFIALLNKNPDHKAETIPTPTPTTNQSLSTSTADPTEPPTPLQAPTITPTQTPCIQQVQPGDTLITLAEQCGHRDLNIIQVILDLNNISNPNQIQVNQTIIIPWPTPVSSGEQTETNTQPIRQDNQPQTLNLPTETLQPGITWHKVLKDENIIAVAIQYGATLRILSELNPEVTFSQCDFGLGSGGPNCIVQLYEGQSIRVPAPTATPTIQPTPSGSETPTPTATPTFNVPSPLTPAQATFFNQDAIITLRWVSTGTLDENQTYQITVTNLDADKIYTATTNDLFFIIPPEWQHQTAEPHKYTWTVAIINNTNPANSLFETQPQQFTWQGRGDNQ
jgi:hypothetical protein